MKNQETLRKLQLDAVTQFKGAVAPLAGFSFAGLVLLANAPRLGVVYLAAYACICVATVALICATVISSMLSSALNFDVLHNSALRWVFVLFRLFSLGGISLFFVGIVLLGFLGSRVIGVITAASVLLFGGITLAVFVTLNRRYSSKQIPPGNPAGPTKPCS